MKRVLTATVALTMSILMLFAFTACGGGVAQETPEDQAVAALDTTLAAIKSADKEAIEELSGGEDAFGDAVDQLGSEEDVDAILKCMFGNFTNAEELQTCSIPGLISFIFNTSMQSINLLNCNFV